MSTQTFENLSYVVTSEVAVPARFAFDYLADPLHLAEWAMGLVNPKRLDGSDTYLGASLFDGSPLALRIDADARRLVIDYLIGPDRNSMIMRTSTRVISGESLDRGSSICLVSMAAWRSASAPEIRWQRLCALHDAEIHLIRERIEQAYKQKK